MERIGPYLTKHKLLDDRGRVLWRAENADGEAFFVQTLRLRKLTQSDDEISGENQSESEAQAENESISPSQKREKQIAKQTARLLSCGSLAKVHAHGGLTDDDGNRVLYWGMPAHEAGPIGKTDGDDALKAHISSPQSWIKLLKDLCAQLKATHDDGHTLGHLSTAWLSRPNDETSSHCLGIGLFIDPDWLQEGDASISAAPEENDECLASGDFWRLGKCLEDFLREDWPVHFTELVTALCQSKVADRLCNFEALAREIEALGESLTSDETELRVNSSAEHQIQDSTRDERPRDPVGSSEFPESVDSGHSTDMETTPSETPSENEPDEAHDKSSELIPKDLSEISTSGEDFDGPATLEDDDLDDSKTNSSPRLEVEAAVWAAPILPVGESPWSEVVSARDTHAKKYHSQFPGFSEELPDHVDLPESINEAKSDDAKNGASNDAQDEANAVEHEFSSEESDPELDFVVSGFSIPKIAIGAVSLLLIFGVFLMILRSSDPTPVLPTKHWLVNRLSEVIVETIPSGAILIAERDGSELGSGPARFLIPEVSFHKLLIWAPGHEAQALILPDRGRIRVSLKPLTDAKACRLRLQSANGHDFEGVGADLGPGPRYQIQGAVIVRAGPKDAVQGAQIVRCPNLGGSPAQVLHFHAKGTAQSIRVTSPAKGVLHLNGQKEGRIPKSVHSAKAFVKLSVETDGKSGPAWWIPVEEGGEIQLPRPTIFRNRKP